MDVGGGHPTTAVIFAGGRGVRFGGFKQFADLGGERIVDRVVRIAAASCDRVVLVLPPGVEWDGATVAATAPGGDSHGESVAAGLAALDGLGVDDNEIVVLVSASHPLARPDLYRRVVAAVCQGADAAAPGRRLPDALKRVVGERVSETLSRHDLVTAQSPSAFRHRTLRAALSSGRAAPEELELMERAGAVVTMVEGESTNLHITDPVELEMARALLPLVDGDRSAAQP